jgi:hypothetical protein
MRQFYTKVAVLDAVARQQQPTQEMADLVARVLSEDPRLADYFFRRLENPAWLRPLYARGFFKKPPDCIETPGGRDCPPWAPSYYLMGMARVDPQTVVQAAREVETDNPRVHLDLIEAATRMEAASAAEMVPPVLRWLRDDSSWVNMLADAAQQLMVLLATQGQPQAALALLKALTEPQVKKPTTTVAGQMTHVRGECTSRYKQWYLKQLIGARVPAFAAAYPIDVARVLEDQLRMCMGLEGIGLPGGDASYLWRRAIEDGAQNWPEDDLKSILTVGLRYALERAVQDHPSAAKKIVERYLKDSLSIFRRVALHLIRVGGDPFKALANQAVRDAGLRDDPALHHEYYRLLEDRFAELPDTVQNEYLGWVDAGPEAEDTADSLERTAGQSPSDDEIRVHKEFWQLERLAPIRRVLPAGWRQRYQSLVDEYGQPEHPEFRIWSSTAWVGPTSPVGKQELSEMGPARTIHRLKEFQASGEPFEDSRWGLAQALQAAVEADPASYVAVADRFLEEGLHPTYVYHLVTGLHESWKKGADLDWKGLLGLFEPVSRALTPEGLALADHQVGIDDTGWVGVRMAISRFLSGALARDDRELAPALLPTIREILLRLIRDPDPTRGDEESRYGGAMDWVSIRINSGRGVAASALLEYALRYARMHRPEHDAAAEGHGDAQRMESSVKAAFSQMLDSEKEASAAVHSLFGQFLPQFLFLDREWVEAQLERVFPPEMQKERYWEAAWQGYMLYCPRIYRELYALLRPQYLRAVAALPRRDTSTLVRDTGDALVQHIALSYRMGHEGLDLRTEPARSATLRAEPKPSLLKLFLEVSSDELRAAFVRGLGSSLAAETGVPPEHWSRMRSYWEARTRVPYHIPRGYEMEQEMSAFVSWVRGVPEDLHSLAPLLRPSIEHLATGHDAHDLLAYLSGQSVRYPLLATKMLRLLLDREAALARGPDVNRIYLIGAEQHIWKILENAMAADRAARQSAISVINMLGERGDYTYRELLRPRG